jgi:hypothetical protein
MLIITYSLSGGEDQKKPALFTTLGKRRLFEEILAVAEWSNLVVADLDA